MRRAQLSPHRCCGLCLLGREPFPAAGLRDRLWESGRGKRRGSAAGRGERGAGEKAAVSERGQLPAPPPHFHKKAGPQDRPARGRSGSWEGARGVSQLQSRSVSAYYPFSPHPPLTKLGTSTSIPPLACPGAARKDRRALSSGQGICPRAPKGGKLQLPACPGRPRRAPLPSVPCCSIQFI